MRIKMKLNKEDFLRKALHYFYHMTYPLEYQVMIPAIDKKCDEYIPKFIQQYEKEIGEIDKYKYKPEDLCFMIEYKCVFQKTHMVKAQSIDELNIPPTCECLNSV